MRLIIGTNLKELGKTKEGEVPLTSGIDHLIRPKHVKSLSNMFCLYFTFVQIVTVTSFQQYTLCTESRTIATFGKFVTATSRF